MAFLISNTVVSLFFIFQGSFLSVVKEGAVFFLNYLLQLGVLSKAQ